MHLVPPRLPGEAGVDPFSAKVMRRRAAGRPSDVPEPWHLTVNAALRRLAEHASEAALHLDTAVALVAERALLRRQLSVSGRGDDEMLAVDASASEQAGAWLALPGADAVYLRSLTRGAELDHRRHFVPRAGSGLYVALPARLSARLLAAGGPLALIATESLAPAIRLEIAAVCAGQTMSEWVAWRAASL